MGIPLLRGRMFSEEDRATSPRVALISESTAAAFFPDRIRSASASRPRRSTPTIATLEGVWRTVIGVVGNVRYKGLHEVQLDMYDPPSQTTVGTTTSLVVRLKPGEERNALAVAAAIQTQARQSDPRALVSGIMMLDDVVNKEIAPWRFSAWVFALFAALAFALVDARAVQPGEPRRGESPPGVRDSHGRRRHQPPHRRRRVPLGRLARGPRHRRRAGGGGRRDAKSAEPAVRRAARSTRSPMARWWHSWRSWWRSRRTCRHAGPHPPIRSRCCAASKGESPYRAASTVETIAASALFNNFEPTGAPR